ncbi:hypothetical protein BVG19_g5690 [[Candida] boidinii]|nr:hypothetical protein BVG19_g5690 [[Candida] boidinii]OWB52002.1 hypothetical protein B5S27_g3573 [[Candida] boidinii]OWB65953.1 hypothetical protein B5S30_g1287 [[Candida] boidinii]
MADQDNDCVIIVHCGAGNHSPNNKQKFKRLIINSLNFNNDSENRDEAIDNLDNSHISNSLKPYLDKFISICCNIESSELTNTGYGSSINNIGRIECDSSIILHDFHNKIFQSTAVNLSYNYPILKCLQDLIISNSKKISRLGLTPFLFKSYLNSNEFNQRDLITKRQKKNYELYQLYLLKDQEEVASGNLASGKLPVIEEPVSDTIGVSMILDDGRMITGTSSGGNLFKDSGRIGCAGVIGSGIYSDIYNDAIKVTVMCSGNGEDIIQMGLSRNIYEYLILHKDEFIIQSDKLTCDLISEVCFESSRKVYLRGGVDEFHGTNLYVGVICYIEYTYLDDDAEEEEDEHQESTLEPRTVKLLSYFHTTENFVFGFKYRGKTEFKFSNLVNGKKSNRGEIYLS